MIKYRSDLTVNNKSITTMLIHVNSRIYRIRDKILYLKLRWIKDIYNRLLLKYNNS